MFMKKNIVWLFAISLLMVGCNDVQKLNKSAVAWEKLKNDFGSSYNYKVVSSSAFGFRDETLIKVMDDEVVERVFNSFDEEGKPTNSWSDFPPFDGHENEGAAPKLVEELYRECTVEVLTKSRRENDIYLSFHEDGVLEVCEYTPKMCADDCAKGVRIDELKFAIRLD